MLALMTELATRAGVPVATVARAKKVEFGDIQINAAMQLAKAEKKQPREIAARIVAAIQDHPAVAKAEIAGPGFVNIFVRDGWLAQNSGAALAVRDVAQGARVVIDYSSPNVAKPLHIAHIRSIVIGDAIKRALKAVGYEVIADNHIGDWGTQFGKLIVAWRKWADEAAFAKDPVAELLRLYIKFQEESKLGKDDEGTDATPLVREARAETVKMQQGDPENRALWKKFLDVSMIDLDRLYQRLGVSFDVTLGESFYHDMLAPTVKTLVDKGIAEESQGALVVFFRKPGGGDDEMPPFLVRKSDGGYNYGTTDVAGVLYRVERWNPARIIIVVDERQQLHFRQLFATARRLGVTCSLEHVWFGLMRLPEGTISTREGKLIELEAMLDEAETRAFAVATEANPELPEAERRAIARVVGTGAVKYNDLSKDRQTLVTFTWDKALSLTGNSGPYLQYAYARIQSILRKAQAEGAAPGNLGALEKSERALLTKLYDYGAAVEAVAAQTRPHLLCDYLFDLAGAFSTFYSEHQVLKAEPTVRASRLQLCALTARALKDGLGLLGIDVLDRM
ncbi:MAG TPA: arginine--tRNA ligase [Polyangia bacterium]|nr:arginine--tRNA ligase [Polyangia bacterium]